MAPEDRLTWTLNTSDGLVWLTWPDQEPTMMPGTVAAGDGRNDLLGDGVGPGVGDVVFTAPGGWPDPPLWSWAMRMATAMARMQAATPAGHQIITVRRVRVRGVPAGSSAGVAGAAAAAARLDPSASTPAGGSASPSSSITASRAD